MFMSKRKMVLTGVCLLVAVMLAGCTGKDEPEKPEKQEVSGSISGDYNQDIGRLVMTDKGCYYYSFAYGTYGYRYLDKETGNDMYLCNKPECKHDGNPFCVATNNKYMILNQEYIYDGKLIVAVVEETDTNYEFKLLELALDGSVASEICTYYKMVKDGFVVDAYGGYKMYIHRDYAFLPMAVYDRHGMEDTERFGVAIVNLKTHEVSYLDEDPLSKENIPTTEITAYGDYFYYCREEGNKTVLYRYSLIDKTIMAHKLLVGFHGKYAVADEEHIIYLKGMARNLCTYHYDTGENKEALPFRSARKHYEDLYGNTVYYEEEYEAIAVSADENYYYVAEQYLTSFDAETGEAKERMAFVNIYNRDFEKVAEVNMASFTDEIPRAEEGPITVTHEGLQYIGDRVYWQFFGQGWHYWYSCTKSDFLTGNPKFELEYRVKINQWN